MDIVTVSRTIQNNIEKFLSTSWKIQIFMSFSLHFGKIENTSRIKTIVILCIKSGFRSRATKYCGPRVKKVAWKHGGGDEQKSPGTFSVRVCGWPATNTFLYRRKRFDLTAIAVHRFRLLPKKLTTPRWSPSNPDRISIFFFQKSFFWIVDKNRPAEKSDTTQETVWEKSRGIRKSFFLSKMRIGKTVFNRVFFSILFINFDSQLLWLCVNKLQYTFYVLLYKLLRKYLYIYHYSCWCK